MSGEGIKINSDKIDAIEKMPRALNGNELTRFLVMLTYVFKFIPNLSNFILRKLTKTNVEYLWLEQHE